MKYGNLAFLCESAKIEEGVALENTITNAILDDISTLSEQEITEGADTLAYLIQNNYLDEPTAQFMLGAVAESTHVIFETDIFALEGKNMDLVSTLMPLKTDLKYQMKSLKKMMKSGRYAEAQELCTSASKTLGKLQKELDNAEDDGMVSSLIGTIIGVLPIILRTLAVNLISLPLACIGIGIVPIVVNAIYSVKEGMEITFAETSNILKHKKVSWNDSNMYKSATSRLINITQSQLKSYQKVLGKLESGKSEDNDIDPASTQKLNDAKASLSKSLNGLTSATKKKK